MRFFLLLLLPVVSGVCHAGYDPLGLASVTQPDRVSIGKVLDYDPFGLNVPPPVTPTSPVLPDEPDPPFCVTVDGIDYNLDEILSEYKGTWTWPSVDGSHNGTDERSLRLHLSSGRHRVTGLDGLDFDTLKKVHSVLHEREEALAASKPKVGVEVKPAPQRPIQSLPRASSPCPGGVCPQPQRSKPVGPVRGLLRGLFG